MYTEYKIYFDILLYFYKYSIYDILEVYVSQYSTMTTATPSSSQRTCHWVPCNIDYDGMAPVHVYFQHEPIPTNNVHAASFRGRGLLGSKHAVNGVVLQQGTSVATFTDMYEWEHESSPALLQMTQAPPTSRVAKDWIELNDAVHGELDVLEA